MTMADIDLGQESFDTIQNVERIYHSRAEAKTSNCMWCKNVFDKIIWAKHEEFWTWLTMMKSKINPSTLSAPKLTSLSWLFEC